MLYHFINGTYLFQKDDIYLTEVQKPSKWKESLISILFKYIRIHALDRTAVPMYVLSPTGWTQTHHLNLQLPVEPKPCWTNTYPVSQSSPHSLSSRVSSSALQREILQFLFLLFPCNGMREILTNQTGTQTWAPWISKDMHYKLSYLAPVFVSVRSSHP